MNIDDILSEAVRMEASDVFIIAGLPVTFKVEGKQVRESSGKLMPDDTLRLVKEIYAQSGRMGARYAQPDTDDDFSFALPNLARFRVNVYHQRGSLAMVIRIIRFGLPDPQALNIPDSVMELCGYNDGLVLIAGPSGSGKTTTLACLIDAINHSRDGHIVTIEDPIEYVHHHERCIVSQREISIDTPSYLDALRSAMRERPEVILLGELRDLETVSAAMTAAETGALLFSTLHTSTAANTIDRIIDLFPTNQQTQIRMQLSLVLKGVVCQRLIPSTQGGLIPAFEIMRVNPAIRNMIRENKIHQIDSAILAGTGEGMCTIDSSLLKLAEEGTITRETALSYCIRYENMLSRLS